MCIGKSTSNLSTIAAFKISCPKCGEIMKDYKANPILQIVCENLDCIIFNKIYIISQPYLIKEEIEINLNCIGTTK